jgi:hypothetical protein
MTDWHEDSAARSRRLRGEKTVEQRLADIEARLDAIEDGGRVVHASVSISDVSVAQDGEVIGHISPGVVKRETLTEMLRQAAGLTPKVAFAPPDPFAAKYTPRDIDPLGR